MSPAAEPFEGDSEEELREYLGDAWTPSAMAEIEHGLLKWDANGFWAASVAAQKHDGDPWELARWFIGRYGGGMMNVRAAACMLRYEAIWAFVSALEAALRDANLIRRDPSGKFQFRPWFTEALCEQPYARRVRLTAMTTKGPDGEDYVGAFDPRALMEVVTQKVKQRLTGRDRGGRQGPRQRK